MPDKSGEISISKKMAEFVDWNTLLFAVSLVAIGLISIYSATYDSGNSSKFYTQIIAGAIGFGGMIGIMFLPERLIKWLTPFFYGFVIFLLILVLLVGKTVYGTKGWINFAGMSIQPSEFAKISVLLALSQRLSNPGANIKTIRELLITGAIVLAPALLIVLEPDDGSATVLFAMYFGVLLWAGFDTYLLFLTLALPIITLVSLFGIIPYIIGVAVAGAIIASFRRSIMKTFVAVALIALVGYISPIIVSHLAPHQKGRIETFLNPDKDPAGKGYNAAQSVLAVGSGGLTGKGFLKGSLTQLRYIPEQWTDFIYCVPTEEFGFIGGGLVVVLIASLIYRSIMIAGTTRSAFYSIFCSGAASILFYHTMINVGMTTGLIPVMGIPLPFLSYGGTSLMVNLAFVGVMLNAYRDHKRTITGY